MNSVVCFPTSKIEGKTREEREREREKTKQLRIIHERAVSMLEISRD